MDRERLQQVQQSDLSESRVNEDFVNWIKTSGPWYLLAILVGIAVYMYLVNLQRAEIREREQAWFDLNEAVMPASLEDVAQRHAEIDSVGTLARLRAANTYLQSLQTNLAVGSSLEEGTPLSDEDRTFGLAQADRLYKQIVSEDSGDFGDTITTVSALNGLAAISESQGDVDAARGYYESHPPPPRLSSLHYGAIQKTRRLHSYTDLSRRVTCCSNRPPHESCRATIQPSHRLSTAYYKSLPSF